MNTKILGLFLVAGLSAMQVEAAALGKLIGAPLIGLMRAMNRSEGQVPMTKDEKIVEKYKDARQDSKCCGSVGCVALALPFVCGPQTNPVCAAGLCVAGVCGCIASARAQRDAEEIRKEYPRLEPRFRRVG